MNYRYGIACITLLALLAGTLPFASAQRTVARRERAINACVLLLTTPADPRGIQPSDGFVPPPDAPTHQYWPVNSHLFPILRQRVDLKPDDLTIVNPAASQTVTQTMATRWAMLEVGQPLGPHMAPYWEVALTSENFRRLAEMDVIYLPIRGPAMLTEEQRRLLTRLTDAGVLLWIDWTGDAPTSPSFFSGWDPGDNSPIPGGLFFPADFDSPAGGPPPPVLPPPPHALFTSEHHLLPAEIYQLGSEGPDPDDPRVGRTINLTPADMVPGGGLAAFHLTPVLEGAPGAGGGAPAYLAAGRYGSGFVVMSAGNIGRAISYDPAWDTEPVLPPGADLSLAHQEDVKFAFNLMAWLDEFSHSQKGPRHQGTSQQMVQGLLERWTEPVPTGDEQRNWMSPLVVDNLVYAPTWTMDGGSPVFWINAFDVDPMNDFSGDGFADDGPPDLSLGAAFDRVAQWPENPGDAPPAIGGLAYGEFEGNSFLFVSGDSGGGHHLWALETPQPGMPPSMPLVPGGIGPPAPVAGKDFPSLSPPTFANTPSPTVYLATGAGSFGRVQAYDVSAGGLGPAWHFPAMAAANTLGPVVGAPAVAQVQDRRTAAIDQVVFVTSINNPAGPGGMGGIVVASRGEPLAYPPGNPGDRRTLVPLRRTERWDPERWWEVRIVDRESGYVMQRFNRATTPGAVQINVDGQPGRIRMPEPVDLDLVAVLADYSVLAQPDPQSGGQRFRQRRYFVPAFMPPGQVAGQQSGVAGGVSVGRDDTIYYGTGRGYMAGVQIAGGQPQVRWKARVVAPTLAGNSLDVDPRSDTYLADYHFTAAPAASHNVIAFASREGSQGRVYVFDADATISFKLPFDITEQLTQQNANSLRLFPPPGGEDDPNTRIPVQQYTVDADTGTVTFVDMRGFTLDLSLAVRVPGDNRLHVPIRAQLGGTEGIARVPVPLVYFFTYTGAPFSSSPIVSGDRIYLLAEDGLLLELPVDPRREHAGFPGPGVDGFDLNEFPGGGLVRARLVSDPDFGGCLASPALGPGVTVVNTPSGITAFTSPSILVADRNRVVEAAPDATLFASTDSLSYRTRAVIGPGGPVPVIQQSALERPSVVRRLNRASSLGAIFFGTGPVRLPSDPTVRDVDSGEHSNLVHSSLLIADTGNDRVVESNERGFVFWDLTRFHDPWKLLPSGEALTLSRPTDAQRWIDLEENGDAPGGFLYVVHTLVTDAGNNRVLEIVDKITATGAVYEPSSPQPLEPARWERILVWATQTNALGLRLNYRNAQRLYWTDDSGVLVDDPGAGPPGIAPNSPPFLPPDPNVAVTVATVQGQRLDWGAPPAPVEERVLPRLRPGGDTLLYLNGRRQFMPDGSVQDAPLRAPSGTPNPDRVGYQQGAISPVLPLVTDVFINPSVTDATFPLRGVSSVQRTLRGMPPERRQYYLLATADGVLEFFLNPAGGGAFEPTLVWGFSNDDYAYVTGAGNGDPDAPFRDASGNQTGGRMLTASSARWLPNAQVLITSKTARSEGFVAAGPGDTPGRLREVVGLGGEVFTLRVLPGRFPLGPVFADPDWADWRPDAWLQADPGLFPVPDERRGLPSITWRMPAPFNETLIPSISTLNPLQLGGTYRPVQPVYADVVF